MKVDQEESFLERIREAPERQNEHQLALSWVYDKAKNLGIKSSVEYFGGTGVSSCIIQELFKPLTHLIFENDKKCVELLSEKLNGKEGVKIELKDSLEVIGLHEADHFSLDFGSFTLLKLTRLKDKISKVFESKPLFVDITDTSRCRLGAHKGRYSEASGFPVSDMKSYVEAYRAYVKREFGYSLNYAVRHFNSYHLGFTREEENLQLAKVSEGKVVEEVFASGETPR